MKKFELVGLSDEKYQCLVLATSCDDPLEDLGLIELNLKEKGFTGEILFDMLGYAGDNSERFLSCSFNGEGLELDTFTVVKISKSSAFRIVTKDYFLSCKDLLDATILTNIQKN
ncbi:type II toxin-antitoxin system RnlB family antitoxin [Bacillus cereus]